MLAYEEQIIIMTQKIYTIHIVDYVGNRRINVLLINHKSCFWTKKYPYFA